MTAFLFAPQLKHTALCSNEALANEISAGKDNKLFLASRLKNFLMSAAALIHRLMANEGEPFAIGRPWVRAQ